MPAGNPSGYLKKPKSVKKPSMKAPDPTRKKAKTTTELERRLKARRKKMGGMQINR